MKNEQEQKHEHHKHSNMGLAISMGADVGLIFGMTLFDNPELVFGAGLGIVFSSING